MPLSGWIPFLDRNMVREFIDIVMLGVGPKKRCSSEIGESAVGSRLNSMYGTSMDVPSRNRTGAST